MKARRDRWAPPWLHGLFGWLEELAEWFEPEDLDAVSVLAGYSYAIRPGLEAEMGEITKRVGDTPVRAAVQFYDAGGNPVAPDAVPSWSSGDPVVCSVEAAEDGLSATVTFMAAGSSVVECATVETAEDGTETTVRATGLVNVDPVDVDAVTGEVTFEEG